MTDVASFPPITQFSVKHFEPSIEYWTMCLFESSHFEEILYEMPDRSATLMLLRRQSLR
jgi:hypothetical protein